MTLVFAPPTTAAFFSGAFLLAALVVAVLAIRWSKEEPYALFLLFIPTSVPLGAIGVAAFWAAFGVRP